MTRVEGVPWFYNNLDSSVATLARRTLLTSSVVQLEMMYPGFQEGALLKEYYNPDSWRPTDEYMNKALFAGQETYEGLKVNFNVALGSFLETHTQGEDDGSEKQAGILYNVKTAMAFVESTLDGKKRRTGEPTMAHIYRVALRMMDQIDKINSGQARNKSYVGMSSDLIELSLLSAVLHDFTEDRIKTDDGELEGVVTSNQSTLPDIHGEMQWVDLHQKNYETGESKEPTKLYPGDFTIDHLANNLVALNKKGTDDEIIAELENAKKRILSKNRAFGVRTALLPTIPALVKLADRADNHDTYWMGSKTDPSQLVTEQKLSEKAKEALTVLKPFEFYLRWYRIYNNKDILLKGISPRLLEVLRIKDYFESAPSGWGKLVLLGLPPSQIYSDEPSKYGLPQLRI